MRVCSRYLWAIPLTATFLLLKGQTTSNTYVDGRVCAECHTWKISQTYALTGMARSFSRPQPQNTLEDYAKGNPFHHLKSDTWYAMTQRDGAYYQRRWRIGYAGKEIDAQESRIDYIMGSGNHARTYLHRSERGVHS